MADKVARRGVTIFIDGTEVKNSVKGIQTEMRKLVNEQAKMIIGSDEYVKHGKKIKELNGILETHKKDQKEIAEGYSKMSKSAGSFTSTLKGGVMVLAGNLMTKALTFLSNALTDTVNKIRSFEKANTVLAGILGENKKNITDLSSSAIDLSKSSKYTASQVTELQTELAKLGFTKGEIRDSQEYILNFATALEAGLGEAAEVAGASLRAFGADTSETERYVSAMTVAANRSAISFEFLATAMPTVAPVANAFNFTIEDTLALLGKLSDSGFDASTAATSLRNILLNLADSNGKLAKALGRPVTNLDELVKGFQDLKNKGIDLATALELTDKRSVAAFQTFLQGADSTLELRDALRDTGDEMKRVAEDQMNNLDGSVLSLQSSWEALMLSFSNSTGILKNVVDLFTSFVDTINEGITVLNNPTGTKAYKAAIDKEYNTVIGGYRGLVNKAISEGEDPNVFIKEQMSKIQANIEKYSNRLDETNKELEELSKLGSIINSPIDTFNKTVDLKKEADDTQYYVEMQKARLKALTDISSDINKLPEADNTKNNSNNKSGDKTSVQRKRVQDALRTLEEQHLKDMSNIKARYLSGDIKTEEEYNQKILKQQDNYDQERKKKLQDLLKSITDPSLRIDIAKQIADIDAKAYDRQISDMEKRRKALAKWNDEETKKIVQASLKNVDAQESKAEQKLAMLRAKNEISDAEYRSRLLENEKKYLEERLRINGLTEEEIAKIRQQLDKNSGEQDINKADTRTYALDKYGLVSLENQKEQELALIKYYEDQGILTHEEAIKARIQADQNYLDGLTAKVSEVNDKVQMIGGNLTGAMTNFASAEESAISRKYDKQIAAAEGNSKKQKKLEEKKQKELNAVKAKYADKQFAVTVAQTISATALAAMEAYKAMAGIPVVGPALGAIAAGAAVAYGASQIAVAKEQRDAAKEGYYKGGYYIDEGYTGGGDPKQVRGYLPDGSPVHGKEFIANHATTSLFSPLFDIFDEAQKHNTVSSISKRDLAKALNIPTGYYQGGYNGSSSSSPTVIRDSRYDEVYERFMDVLERLDEKMDVPFKGYVTYKGDDGIEEAQNLDQKMIKNVSR